MSDDFREMWQRLTPVRMSILDMAICLSVMGRLQVNAAVAAGGAWSIADPRHPLHGRRREDARRRADSLRAQLADERRRLEETRRECDRRSGAATKRAELERS